MSSEPAGAMIVLEFTESWRARYPDAGVGLLAMTAVAAAAPGLDLLDTLRATEAEVRIRHAGHGRRDLENLPTMRPYVDHYRRFGKTYHVLLQLESIIAGKRSLVGTDTLVNAMFAAEVETGLLTAGHDLDSVRAPLIADVTRRGERYVGIGERAIEVKLGDLSIRDRDGILSTVIYGPDQRTRLKPQTRAVLFTTYAPAGIADDELMQHLRRVEALVRAGSPAAITDRIEIRRPARTSFPTPG